MLVTITIVANVFSNYSPLKEANTSAVPVH
jgi:hypothetical protein